MNNLLTTNRQLENRIIYIDIDGGLDALKAFGVLLNKGIYVSGFVSDDMNLRDVEIFNKRIFHKGELPDRSVMVLGYICNGKKSGVYEMNPELKKDVFIFGAGYVGNEVYKILQDSSKNIIAYIDTDPKKIGGQVNDIEVCGVNVLQGKNIEEYSLIIAADQYHEIDEIVNRINPAIYRFYWSTDDGSRIWVDEAEGCDSLGLYEINELCNLACGKQVYLYGKVEGTEKIRQCLRLVDLEFGGYLVDGDAGEYKCEQVMCVEEILYEEEYFIIIMENVENSMRLLTEMGLQCSVDFVPICLINSSNFYTRKNVLDMNLGHSFINSLGCEGYYEYPGQTDQYKIAVMGGSTTDGGVYTFRSWPEIFYEKLGREVTLYNFGVSSYTSSQELIKLIRDVLDFNPDMVITYDGYNDSMQKDQEFFSFPYLREIFEYSEKGISDSCWWMFPRGKVHKRKEKRHRKDNFDMWVSNIVLMREICRLYGIKFYAFLQPMLPTKMFKDKKEMAIMLLYRLLEDPSYETKFDFRERIEEQNICEQYDYVYDLSDIFDDQSDIYIDICHVYEKGNEIIADEIYKRVKKAEGGFK